MEKDWLRENEHIVIGLKDVVEVFEPDQYRVFGSLIPAALGGTYKKINDLDLLVDEKAKKMATQKLKAKGYKIAPVKGIANVVGVIPLRFSKGSTLIDMFFGQVEKNGGWRYPLRFGFSLYLPPDAWKSYPQLKFSEVEFACVNLSAAYYLTMLLEKKAMAKYKRRSRDLEILTKFRNLKEIEKIKRQKPGLWWKSIHLPMIESLVAIGNVCGIVDEAVAPTLVKSRRIW